MKADIARRLTCESDNISRHVPYFSSFGPVLHSVLGFVLLRRLLPPSLDGMLLALTCRWFQLVLAVYGCENWRVRQAAGRM